MIQTLTPSVPRARLWLPLDPQGQGWKEGETDWGWRSCRVPLFPSFTLQLSSHRAGVGQVPRPPVCPKKSLILHKSFCTSWALFEEVDVDLLEGDTAHPGTTRSPQLSQTQACTEVYKFSKAFDNVKLLGDEVGGEHTAAMYFFVYVCNI